MYLKNEYLPIISSKIYKVCDFMLFNSDILSLIEMKVELGLRPDKTCYFFLNIFLNRFTIAKTNSPIPSPKPNSFTMEGN